MARRNIRGRRTAGGADRGIGGDVTNGAGAGIKLGGSEARVARSVPDGDYYDLEVTGARAVTGKTSGATSVILSVLDRATGNQVLLHPLLVHSPGGDSNLTYSAKAVLEALLGLREDDEIDLAAALTRLPGVRFSAYLRESTINGKDPANVIDELEVLPTEAKEA